MMPDYRRYFKPGAMCFFTVNLKNRKSYLLVERIDDLAVCILPDHLHCILKLPEGDGAIRRAG